MLRLPPDQMLQRAEAAFKSMQLPFAEQACRSVLAVQPDRGVAWLLLARIVMEQSRLEEVEELLNKADRFRAPGVEVMHSRASLYWRQGRDEDCLRTSREILSVRPGDEEALCRMASSERRMGHTKDAIDRVRPFIPRNPVAATVAAWAYLDEGDPAAALAAALPAVENPSIAQVHRSNLWHVIGFAQEKLERYDEALASYGKSKEIFQTKLDEGAMRKNFNELRQIFSAEFMRTAPRAKFRTQRPVFIASMPRSGTTLLDRIIASHPNGAGAGETRALRGQITEWGGGDVTATWPQKVPGLTVDQLDAMAKRYIRETDQFGASALRTADKHLMNWLTVGLINMVFPEARVIHLRRDPVDVGISCFERLRPSSVPWANSLRSIGIAMKACDVMMDHWKTVATIPILTVEYETLVRDPAAETRRIIEFLGLPWDDACLAHHERGSKGKAAAAASNGALPPPTLSSEQASKPIFDSSIGRGARFGAGLDELRRAYAEPF